MASLVGGIQDGLLEDALAAVELCNEIVHEGFIPDSRDVGRIRVVPNVDAKLVPGPPINFPIRLWQQLHCNTATPDAQKRSCSYDPVVVGGVSITDA